MIRPGRYSDSLFMALNWMLDTGYWILDKPLAPLLACCFQLFAPDSLLLAPCFKTDTSGRPTPLPHPTAWSGGSGP